MLLHSPLLLSIAGVALATFTHYRFSSGLVAWFVHVPFIIYVADGDKSRWGLFLAMVAAGIVPAMKIMTPPLPISMSLLFGLPDAPVQFACYMAWTGLFGHMAEWLQALGFASIMVLAEYAQHAYLDGGSWGNMAYTQLYNLPFLQLASLVGLAGPSFLMHWFSALVGLGLSTKATKKTRKEWPVKSLAICVAIVTAVHVWGAVRLDDTRAAETVMLAAVDTDATSFGCMIPEPCGNIAQINDALFERSERAAEAGARLISWAEGATHTTPSGEARLLERGQKFARKHGVEMVLAYLLRLQSNPLQYKNKAVWIRPDGTVDHSYLKNKPVPIIEAGAIPGEPKTTAVNTAFGNSALAICYDFDFPNIGNRLALAGVQLAVVPGYDWKGIDPTHTQMAGVRAVEGGYAVLRTAAMGLSAGIDQYGQIHGRLSSNQSKERLLLVTLPIPQGGTVYTKIGDVFVYAIGAFLLSLPLFKAGVE